jgi:hypothetical protein
MSKVATSILSLFILFCSTEAFAQDSPEYRIESSTVVSGGRTAPFWLSTNKYGLQGISRSSSFLEAGIFQKADTAKKITFAYGVDLAKSSAYKSEVIVQQLYAALHYKKAVLSVGMQERTNGLQNQMLSSCGGGTLWSVNARPLPEICFGIPDFVTVFQKWPWLQAKAEMSYGWLIDNGYQLEASHTQNGFGSLNGFLHRKAAAIRYKGNSRWSFTFAGEIDVEFGGKQVIFNNGQIVSQQNTSGDLKHMLMTFIPFRGDKSSVASDQLWFYGNYVGNWQGRITYSLNNTQTVHAYLDNYFEDSSAFWKLNGLDGLWGFEYSNTNKLLINNIVIEYYQSTNQSGSIMYRPKDFTTTNISHWAMGSDNYYNHGYYIGWSNYGMGIGSPLVTSPIYNTNGHLNFENNRVIAYHLGVSGYITPNLSHRILLTYRKGLGTMSSPYIHPQEAFSGLAEVSYHSSKIQGLDISLSAGIDAGHLTGNNAGFNLSIKKSGLIQKLLIH